MSFPFDATLKDIVQDHAAETERAKAARLMAGAYILAGLRLPRESLADLFRGVAMLEESSTYQHILELGRQEGQVRQAQSGLLRLGRQQFGRPRVADERAVLAITDLNRLNRMTDAILTAASWAELLATS
jgi:predicted transposase YdaD